LKETIYEIRRTKHEEFSDFLCDFEDRFSGLRGKNREQSMTPTIENEQVRVKTSVIIVWSASRELPPLIVSLQSTLAEEQLAEWIRKGFASKVVGHWQNGCAACC
jgi:hypothetical protein